MTTVVPRVSVVMPVHNAERFLRPAIDSILAQTLDDLELIVVENGSTDGTRDVIAAAVDRDRRLRPMTIDEPDLVAALNAGLAAARAPLVARMDGDDVAHRDRLARQVRFLDGHPDVAVVSSAYREIDESDAVVRHVRMPTRSEGLMELLRHQCLFSHPGVMLRRDVVLEVGGYRPGSHPAEDFDLWLRLLDAGHHLENLEDELLDYRIVASGVSRSRTEAQIDRSLRAVMLSRLRGLDVEVEPSTVDAAPRDGLVDLLPTGRLSGLRLVLAGYDLDHLEAASAAELDRIAGAVDDLSTHDEVDTDRAMLAFRLATRFRRRGRLTRALRWYAAAWRADPRLTRALAIRSGRGLMGRIARLRQDGRGR